MLSAYREVLCYLQDRKHTYGKNHLPKLKTKLHKFVLGPFANTQAKRLECISSTTQKQFSKAFLPPTPPQKRQIHISQATPLQKARCLKKSGHTLNDRSHVPRARIFAPRRAHHVDTTTSSEPTFCRAKMRWTNC